MWSVQQKLSQTHETLHLVDIMHRMQAQQQFKNQYVLNKID